VCCVRESERVRVAYGCHTISIAGAAALHLILLAPSLAISYWCWLTAAVSTASCSPAAKTIMGLKLLLRQKQTAYAGDETAARAALVGADSEEGAQARVGVLSRTRFCD